MQEILSMCISLDERAVSTYAQLAEACPDEEMKLTFQHMGMEEVTHVAWWTELLAAWEEGLVPDIADESGLRSRIKELSEEIDLLLPLDFTTLSTDGMLDLAAHMEFFMLDPVFGELLDLLNPGSNTEHHQAYSRHVMRLVSCIEARHSRGDLAHFLARVLSRSFSDQQRLASLAMHDQLTGLYNRRGFYGYLRQLASWSARYEHPLGVLLVDVDHFKDVNDTFGHPAGDDALRAISSALCQAVRSSDVVGRYGGDEFAILAPETSADELELLSERVLNVVRALGYLANGQAYELSVSVGAAIVDGGRSATPEQLLSAADHSLYGAKAAGRDQAGNIILVRASA